MSNLERKTEELNFHFDRVRESSLKVIQSVINNPSLRAEEQLVLLTLLAEKHAAISNFIHCQLDSGFIKGLAVSRDRPSS